VGQPVRVRLRARAPGYDMVEPVQPDDAWDAGDLGCGELVIVLRWRLLELRPGAHFHLTATDPGAIHDIPAWCRLTGHGLVSAAPPRFLIRRRD
jgi:tRNA 2-thiouridine synthesizing protein A